MEGKFQDHHGFALLKTDAALPGWRAILACPFVMPSAIRLVMERRFGFPHSHAENPDMATPGIISGEWNRMMQFTLLPTAPEFRKISCRPIMLPKL